MGAMTFSRQTMAISAFVLRKLCVEGVADTHDAVVVNEHGPESKVTSSTFSPDFGATPNILF
jgi:hypothetical protein